MTKSTKSEKGSCGGKSTHERNEWHTRAKKKIGKGNRERGRGSGCASPDGSEQAVRVLLEVFVCGAGPHPFRHTGVGWEGEEPVSLEFHIFFFLLVLPHREASANFD